MALMAALTFVLSQFTIAIGDTFKLLSLSYLPGAVVGCLFGPWAGVAFGFVADTVGYIARPMGPWFPGYALSAMIVNFIYALFLYRQRLSVPRVTLAHISQTLLVTLGVNYLWNIIMYGAAAGTFFTGQRIVNNIVQIPLHVFLTWMFCRLARRLEAGRISHA
jgi:ECF transporter S component (folate family)